MSENGKESVVGEGPHKRVLWRGKAVFVADPGSAIAGFLAQYVEDHPEQVRTLTDEEMEELAAAPELTPAPLPVAWAKSLRQIRHEHDLSLQALSRKSGAAYRTLSMIEHGERVPNWRTIRKISDALGVHPDEVREFAEAREAEAVRMGLDAPLTAAGK